MTADNKQQTAADGRTLVIAAAGTGGHVMPGLAVARVMADRGWKIVWIGTTTGMEKGLVERQGIEFHPLNFQGMRGSVFHGRLHRCAGMLCGAESQASHCADELRR